MPTGTSSSLTRPTMWPNGAMASSLRAKLANLLSSRSDTLIMLSATPARRQGTQFCKPHEHARPHGHCQSGGLRPGRYQRVSISGASKKTSRIRWRAAFKARKISVAHCEASPAEEQAFDTRLLTWDSACMDQRKGAGRLFQNHS